MTVRGADEMARTVVIVTDFRSFWIFVFQERLATNLALNRIVVLLLLCTRLSLHWNIVIQMIFALSFPIDQSVEKLADHIFINRMPSP